VPAYLLRDRDSIYGLVFRQRAKGLRVACGRARGSAFFSILLDAQGPAEYHLVGIRVSIPIAAVEPSRVVAVVDPVEENE
jgi:hypothetical protein